MMTDAVDRDKRLAIIGRVYSDWVGKHLGEPGFDPDAGFTTPEQDRDYFDMLQRALADN
jgi:hypothetical protein